LPYLTGEWSKKFDYAPMPFDGILFGSRMMVAKEGRAAQAVKELIIAARGVYRRLLYLVHFDISNQLRLVLGVDSEADWEKTYKGEIGGVITVKSELGEPIHKIANRAILFWKELDDLVFSLPRGEKRAEAVAKRKEWIITKLNKDYQKPFFGKKNGGHVADLHEVRLEDLYRFCLLLSGFKLLGTCR
jgi:fatty acid synthase subunit alpha, fungi type